MLALLVEILGEFLLQWLGEALVEWGLHALGASWRRQCSAWCAALGYALAGGALGGLSLLVWPHHGVTSLGARVAHLVFTPVAIGALMAALGGWRASRGQALWRIDHFAFGYLFALAWALVRFLWAD